MVFVEVLLFVVVAGFVGTQLYLRLFTRWCKSQRCLVGKTVLVTGGNSGIGYHAALDFAKRGARVILGCRDKTRGEEACREIINTTDNTNIHLKIVDFSSFASIRNFAKEIKETENRLDVLVNNAGISFADDLKTEDGYDIVMQVNYYSHFLLTNLLIGLMAKSGAPSRIVNVSSLAAKHATDFDIINVDKFEGNMMVYAKSKLCNILFTKELAKRLHNTNITTYSLHPGAIKTNIFRRAHGISKILLDLIVSLFYKDVVSGCQTILYCALEKDIEHLSGQHFDNCQKSAEYKTAGHPGDPEKLWKITEKIVKLENTNNN